MAVKKRDQHIADSQRRDAEVHTSRRHFIHYGLAAGVTAAAALPVRSTYGAGESTSQAAATRRLYQDGDKKLSGKIKIAFSNFPAQDGIDPATGDDVKGFSSLIKPMLEKNPDLQIELSKIVADSPNATLAKIQTLLLSGAVDIIQGATFWPFYEQGLVADLTKYYKRDDWKSHFNEALFRHPQERFYYPPWSMTTDTIYAAPVGLETFSVAYDKAIFEHYGVEPLSQTPTIDEVLEKAAQLTGKDPQTGQDTYGMFYDPRTQSHIMLYYFGHGVDFGTIDPKNPAKLTFNTPQVKEGILQMIASAKYSPPGFEIGQGIENWGTENNTAAIRMVAWPQDMLTARNNELQDRFVITEGIRDKSGHTMFISSLAYIIAKESKNADTAWEVLKYLSGPDGQKFAYENYNYLPSWSQQDWVDASHTPYAKAFMGAASAAENAFFPQFMFTTFRPWMASIVSQAVNGKSYDLDAGLADMQRKAEAWVTENYGKK